jgi:hypothetical protein
MIFPKTIYPFAFLFYNQNKYTGIKFARQIKPPQKARFLGGMIGHSRRGTA